VVALCREDIRAILVARDASLSAKASRSVLGGSRLEILSCQAIALDGKLEA
jgi:hypothetical protein